MVTMTDETLSFVIDGGGPKGDVLGVAELAGVMGAKRTSELIPLCHPLPLTDLQVTITPDRASSGLRIRAEAATTGQTGVEMEAMTAVSIAALTVYDMVKGVERGVTIGGVRLLAKTGGKSGDWIRAEPDGASGGGLRRPGARAAGRIGRSAKAGGRASGRRTG
jgi:cyclic pyranopterin phosphate synthase